MEITSSEYRQKKVSFLRRKRKWIIILSVFAGVIITLLLTAQIIAQYFETKIKDVFIQELNKNLTTQVSFKDFDLSLLEHFPYASFKFIDVVALDATPAKEGVLLKTETLSLQFNVFDLIDKNYTIKDIEIRKGTLRLKYYKDGTTNYHFWQSTTDSSDARFKIDLNKIRLNNVQVFYRDYDANQDYELTIYHSILKGKFTEKTCLVEGKANVYCKRITSFGINYCRNKPASIDIELDVDNVKDIYHIRNSDLKIGRLNFTITGNIINQNAYKKMNLKVLGNQINLQELLDEMPVEYASELSNYKGKGILDIKIDINGLFHELHLPQVVARFNLQHASIEQVNSGSSLEELSLQGSFSNGNKRNATTFELLLNSFNAKLKSGQINGRFSMRNFIQPLLNLNVSASLNLADVKEFFQIDTLNSLTGLLNMNVDFKGQLHKKGEFTIADFTTGTTIGSGTIQKSSFTFKGSELPYTIDNASFSFDNNDLRIPVLALKIKNTDLSINGTLANLIPYMLQKNQQISITGSVVSSHVNLDELLNDNTDDSKGGYRFYMGDDIRCDLNIDIAKINFRKFNGSVLLGSVRVADSKMLFNNVSMLAFGGKVSLNGIVDAANQNQVTTRVIANVSRVDISKLFYQLENFGQQNIEDKHLRGLLSSEILYSAKWSHDLTPDINSIVAQADVTIEQGQLLNYQPMANLSRFVKLDDLMNIKFATLKNKIDIRNKIITIPSMEIKSNTLDISLSGTHTFANEINYRMTLLLSDLLASKAKKNKKENEFFAEQDDNYGRTKLFILITGTIDYPIFKYDKVGVKEKIKTDIKVEKQTVKQILKEEWGLFKKDSMVKPVTTPQAPKYKVIWDESDDDK